jgi:hypothetical protein
MVLLFYKVYNIVFYKLTDISIGYTDWRLNWIMKKHFLSFVVYTKFWDHSCYVDSKKK